MNKLENKKEHYFFIDTLRAVACFFVVFHHTLIYATNSTFADYYRNNLKMFFLTVPLYLTVSGFVHSQNITHKQQNYLGHLADKCKRILIPYFVISIITLLFRLIAESFNLVPLSEHQFTPFVWSDAISRVLFAGIEGHYYFLLILFAYLAAFPLIIRLCKSNASVLISFILIFVIDAVLETRYESWHTQEWSPWNLLVTLIAGFKFFYFGFVLQRFFPYLSPLFKKHGVLVALLAVVVYTTAMKLAPTHHEQFLFFQMIAYFSFAYALLNKRRNWVHFISGLSFGIYILHQPYFIKLTRIESSLIPLDPNIQFILSAVLAFASTAAFVWLISPSVWVNRLLFGQKWGSQKQTANENPVTAKTSLAP